MVLFRKHLNKTNLYAAMKKVVRCLVRGQTNFARSTLNFRSLPNPRRRYADHFRKIPYTLQPLPQTAESDPDQFLRGLYVHAQQA